MTASRMVSVQLIRPVTPTRAATSSAAVAAANQAVGEESKQGSCYRPKKRDPKRFDESRGRSRKLASRRMDDVIGVSNNAEREAAEWWTKEKCQGSGVKAAFI